MKKTIAITAAFLLSCSAMSISAVAAEKTEVYVTIADKDGGLPVAQEKIEITDTDGDGQLTISDALYVAHEKFYNGGAAAGYTASEGSLGLWITKLWGTENGGSYGYYVNNVSAMSIEDTVKDGDYVSAYVFRDLTGWSDSYCWFDVQSTEAEQGDEVSLTLYRASFDEDWNAVTLPVEGASITVNGSASGSVTDAEGKAKVKLESAGRNVISATSDSLVLVPPVCIANVAGEAPAVTTTTTTTKASTTATTTAKTTTKTTAKTTASGSSSPKTGDTGTGVAVLGLAAAAATAFLIRRRNEE